MVLGLGRRFQWHVTEEEEDADEDHVDAVVATNLCTAVESVVECENNLGEQNAVH